MSTGKKTAGPIVHLVEELGDARLLCDELVAYTAEAIRLIENSSHKEHFFEVAGHLIQGAPGTLKKLHKSIQAAALAANQIDSEELKRGIQPGKVRQLERAFEDVRIRELRRHSEKPMITPEYVAEKLRKFAAETRESGLPESDILRFVGELSTPKQASEPNISLDEFITKLAEAVESGNEDYSRLASVLRRMVADNHVRMQLLSGEDDKQSRFEKGKPADPTKNMSPEDKEEWENWNEKNKDKFKKEADQFPCADPWK